MPRLLPMPEVAAGATDAVLAEWLVDPGGTFGADDAVATVETEKAVVDIEADGAGVLVAVLVPPGAQVAVGAPIALLGAPGEVVADVDAALAELGAAAPIEHDLPARRDVPADPGSGAPLPPEPEPELEPDPELEPEPEPAASRPAPAADPGPAPGRRVFASPLARRIARDAGIGLDDLPGTGPRGRVLRRDVEAALEARSAEPAAPLPVAPTTAPAAAATAGTTDVPHSRLRRAIAARLTESVMTAPHFYVRATVRADRLVALRAELNHGADVRVSVNDLVVKAVGAAHTRVPEMNVVWTPDAVRRHASVDVAVAVATEGGLLTPVVRDVPGRTVGSLAAAVHDLADRARAGRLRQDELEGGTISVTNLGGHGVEEFAAIINPPHAAILAVGAVREAAVVADGDLVVGQVMSLTLSVDHRPVDGVVAARWMAALTEVLERPVRLLA